MPIAESEKAVRVADLKAPPKEFALRIMKVVDALPRTIQGRVIANQIIRNATSVAANYRAACRARSEAGELIAIMAGSRKSALGNRKSAIK